MNENESLWEWMNAAAAVESSIIRIFLVISWSQDCYWCAKCNFHEIFFQFFFSTWCSHHQRHSPITSFQVSSSFSYFFFHCAHIFNFDKLRCVFAKWKWYKLTRPQNDQEVLSMCIRLCNFAWTYLTGYKMARWGKSKIEHIDILIK